MTRCCCSVDGCLVTSYNNQHLKFFRMPLDPHRYLRWMNLIGRPDLAQRKNHYICEKHFSEDCFQPGGKKLKRDAVPCANLPPTSISTIAVLHKSTQCPSRTLLEQSTKTTKKRDRPPRVKRFAFSELCDKLLTPEISQIVKAQVDFKKKFFDDNRIDGEYMYFCLKFFYTSPAGYVALQASLNLPNKKSLSSFLTKSIETDHSNLYKTLSAKIDCMSDLEKNCSLLVGYIKLKPHLFYHIKDDKIYGFCENNGQTSPNAAANAIVVFAKGIYEPWVLPVNYALFPTKEADSLTISSWVNNTISALLAIGLHVRICITNLSPTIITAASKPPATISVHKPYFTVADKRIYFMLDPTFTIKRIFNCFQDHEFHSQRTMASWTDIVDFYNHDSKKTHRLAPRLTEKEMNCSGGTDVPYSSVLNSLSAAVAAGLATHIEISQLDSVASGTVHFLTIMSNLIDFTRSCNTPHYREFKRPFEGSNAQIQTIVDSLNYLHHLNLFKNNIYITDNVEFITDFQIAIKSLLMLSEDLKLENYPNLFTRNISFNSMSNFFGTVSKQHHRTGEFLAWRLISEFRKIFFRNVLRTPKYRFCPEILNGVFYEYLSNKAVIPDIQQSRTDTPMQASFLSTAVMMSDYKHVKLPRKDQMKAVGVFVLNKCLEKHPNCTLPNPLRKQECVYDDDDDPPNVFRYPQFTYCPEKQRMIPDPYFILFLLELERDLENYLKCDFSSFNYFLLKLFHRSDATLDSFRRPCPCFPVDYLRKLFYRLRLSQIMRAHNEIYKTSSQLNFSYTSLS